MKITTHNNPYVNLANAVITKAAEDYVKAWKRKQKGSISDIARYDTEREIHLIETFFLSDWFQALTDADGKTIIRMLQKEAESKQKKPKKKAKVSASDTVVQKTAESA